MGLSTGLQRTPDCVNLSNKYQMPSPFNGDQYLISYYLLNKNITQYLTKLDKKKVNVGLKSVGLSHYQMCEEKWGDTELLPATVQK